MYKANNNPFGFKVATKRKQVGKIGSKASDGGNYWHYPNDTDAFKDLLNWMAVTKFPTSVNDAHEYTEALKKRSYFTDSNKNYYFGLMRYLDEP